MPGTGLDTATEEVVRARLLGLLENFEKKRATGRKLISDEEAVYASLRNPRLGDVRITVFPGKAFQVFVSNKRNPDSPFAVMEAEERRQYVERRPLDDEAERDTLPALYLIDHSDRELLRDRKVERVEFFSAFLKLSGETEAPAGPVVQRPYEDLDLEERMEMLQKLTATDPMRERIARDLFEFTLTFARYKQPEKPHALRFPPGQVREYVGQLARDMYPQNLRYVFLRDFPGDHEKYSAYVRDRLLALKNLVQGRRDLAGGRYAEYLHDIQLGVDEQIAKLDDMHSRER